ncbi:hypothetical protein Tco_1106492 [Tanacetum coccineum]
MDATRGTGVCSPTDLRRDSGKCRHAARNCFKYGQTGHLQQDDKKDTATKELPGISSIRDELKDKVTRVVRTRFYSPKCITMGRIGSVCQEEGRVVEGFSRLALPLTKLTRKDEKLYGSKSERRSLKNVHGDGIWAKRVKLRMRATFRLLSFQLCTTAIPRTDIELTTAIQAAVQAMLPQIRE